MRCTRVDDVKGYAVFRINRAGFRWPGDGRDVPSTRQPNLVRTGTARFNGLRVTSNPTNPSSDNDNNIDNIPSSGVYLISGRSCASIKSRRLLLLLFFFHRGRKRIFFEIGLGKRLVFSATRNVNVHPRYADRQSRTSVDVTVGSVIRPNAGHLRQRKPNRFV